MSSKTDVYLKYEENFKDNDIAQYVTTKEIDNSSKNVKTGDVVFVWPIVLIAIVLLSLIIINYCRIYASKLINRNDVWRKSDN